MSDAANATDWTGLELSTNELLDLLSDGRRLTVLQYLVDRNEEVSLEGLSTAIANGEGGSADQPPEQLSIVLHHAHLPKLSDGGLVRYDPKSRTVEPTRTATELSPLLHRVASLDE